MNNVLEKEIDEISEQSAQILNVLKAIAAREKCIQLIRDIDKKE